MSTNKQILLKLKGMTIDDRINYLKQSNITKTNVCNQLINSDQMKKIPMKSMIIKLIGNMSEEDFLKFVAENIDKVPEALLDKLG